MKYLQDDRLSALTSRFFFGDDSSLLLPWGGRRRVWGRIEAYTMKRAGTDKKYAADLGSKYVTLQERLEDRLAREGAAGSFTAPLEGSSPPDRDSWGLSLLQPHQARLQSSPARMTQGEVGATAETTTTAGATVKRRSQSVGFQDDFGPGSRKKNKARSRSNSLDESSLVVYRTNLGDFAAQETRRLMTDLILTLNMSFPDYDFDCVSPNDFVRCPLPDVVRHVDSLLGELAAAQQQASAADVRSGGGGGEAVSPPTLPAPEQPPGDDEDGHGVDDNHLNDSNDGRKGQPKDNLLAELWSALDHVISLSECEVYRWKNHPDDLLLQGPDGGGGGEDDEEPVLWSFYYLFVNKARKRIVFLGCCETLRNRSAPSSSAGRLEEDADEEVHQYDLDLEESPDRADDYYDATTDDADAELVSDDDDDDDESSRMRYTRMLSSGGDGSDVDFDLDPSAVAAGGIPISTA